MPKLSVSTMEVTVMSIAFRDQLKSLLNAGDRSSSRGDSDSGDWKRRRVEMKTGTNIITWLVVNAGGKQVGSILVSRIDIMGKYN